MLFTNVAELQLTWDDAGKRIGLVLADRDAEGTFAAGNTIRPWPNGDGFSFVIEDRYRGTTEELIAAIDSALTAWRADRPDAPGVPKPWLR